MASSIKLQKEIEIDIHEQLYSNISILTLKYPTTKEFNACFKKDMFIKNNKAAYLHIVHFLLNIMDPTFFKQRNIWPILDVKMETQFRNELMKYINELNSTNKETGIPLLMTSHLISPGGYRFADFIFRLSQFVLSEYVKRETGNNLIPFPPKASNNYSFSLEQVKHMEKIIDDQYNNLTQKQKLFKLKFNAAKESIQHIKLQQPIVEQETKETEDKIDGYLNESEIAHVFQTLPQRKSCIDEKLIKLEKDSYCFQKCSTLITILNENKNIVNCSVEISNTSQVSNQSKQKTHVDLIDHFETLLESINNNKYIIKNRRDPNLPEYLSTSSEILRDLGEYNDKYDELITELELCISHLEQNNSSAVNNVLHYDVLTKKLHKLFESIPPINFPILM